MFKYSPFHISEPKKQEKKIMTLPIKQHRKKLGLTQKALAAKLGVSLPSVVNWENGKISPKGKNLAKVKKFLSSSNAAPKKVPKKAAAPKKRGRPKGKVEKPKKSAIKKTVGRPKKAAPKAATPKKRGRPKKRASMQKSGVSRQLSGVAKDLGFANVEEMVKTILRKHKIGKLDL